MTFDSERGTAGHEAGWGAGGAATATTRPGGDEPAWQVVLRGLQETARARAQLEALELELLLRADACDLHRQVGCVSLAEVLERVCGYSRHAANERIRVAFSLQRLPAMRAAFEAGALSFSHARELTRVATPQTEDAYLAAAAGTTSRQVQALVAGKRYGDPPDAPPDPALVRHTLRLELGGEAYAMWRRAQQVLEQEVDERLSDDELVALLCRGVLAPGPAPVDGAEVSPAPSRGDQPPTGDLAAPAPFPRSAGLAADHPAPAGAGEPALRESLGDRTPAGAQAPRRRPRIPAPATLHAVTTCRVCKRATASAAGSAEPLTAAQRDRALCDALTIGDLDTDARTPPTLTIPAALRRKVMVAFNHACAVPGCRSRRHLDVHHLREQAHGGTHTIRNMVLLCSSHHQRLHEGRLRITGVAPHALDVEWRHLASDDDLEAGGGPFVWRRAP